MWPQIQFLTRRPPDKVEVVDCAVQTAKKSLRPRPHLRLRHRRTTAIREAI